jgi:hypothetical protein
MRQPQTKHVELHHLPGDRGGELAEIDLRLRRRRMGLRHHHLTAVAADLDPQPRHQIPHRRFPDPCAFLLDQPLPDPAGRMPLLPRRLQILHQPTPDKINMSAQHRRLPRRGLPRRRDRVRQRLTHRPAVHCMSFRKLPDRQTLTAGIPSDTFELLHSRSLLHTLQPSESPWQTSRK